jgi:hypothetical protein
VCRRVSECVSGSNGCSRSQSYRAVNRPHQTAHAYTRARHADASTLIYVPLGVCSARRYAAVIEEEASARDLREADRQRAAEARDDHEAAQQTRNGWAEQRGGYRREERAGWSEREEGEVLMRFFL